MARIQLSAAQALGMSLSRRSGLAAANKGRKREKTKTAAMMGIVFLACCRSSYS